MLKPLEYALAVCCGIELYTCAKRAGDEPTSSSSAAIAPVAAAAEDAQKEPLAPPAQSEA